MIKLGDRVKDRISGLTGIATERREYLNGCVQYAITPKIKPGATELPAWCIDEQQIDVLTKKKAIVKKRSTGGPTIKCT